MVEPGFGAAADVETAHSKRHKRTRECPRPWRKGRGVRSGVADSPSRRDQEKVTQLQFLMEDEKKSNVPRPPDPRSNCLMPPDGPDRDERLTEAKGVRCGERRRRASRQTLNSVESCSKTSTHSAAGRTGLRAGAGWRSVEAAGTLEWRGAAPQRRRRLNKEG